MLGFVFLLVAPIPLLIAAAHDVFPGPQRRRVFLLHAAVLLVALLFHPILQKLPGFDTAHAASLLERAESLHVVGKTEQEVIALLGSPSYVLVVDDDKKQLRYRHWLPILWDAQFFVAIDDGRAYLARIDWD